MFSSFPKTPERGRSRFSKVLPVPPENSSKVEERTSPALTSKYMHSPLPPLPISKEKMAMATVPRRRPVAGAGVQVGSVGSTKSPSIRSVSSNYSDSPELSHSLSDVSTKDSLSGVDSDATPPLPPKDSQRQQAAPKTPNKLLDSPLANFSPSPPREEIWRRRSVKSDRSIVFPNLKLQKSNGSTASPPRRQEPPAERALPRSIAGRKPVPVRPAPPHPDLMGNKLAKLRNKSREEKENTREDSSKHEAPKQQIPPPQRLPTPDYLKADEQQPITPQILSPVSPFTPPEEKPPVLPEKSEYRPEIRKNALRTNSESTTIRPNMSSSHSRDTSETLTITSEAPVIRSPQPNKALPTRLLTPQPGQDKTSPLSLPSPINALATHFPTIQSPAIQGTIFPGPPLGIVHFDCYQSHKFMRSTRNTLCPVACMICKRKDTDTRWRCTWCCLSACGSCMQILSSIPGKDLKICLERIGH